MAQARGEEGFVHARSTFVAVIQSTKAVQPRERPLDDPARAAEAAALWPPAFGELRRDSAPFECVAMRLRIVVAVALHEAARSGIAETSRTWLLRSEIVAGSWCEAPTSLGRDQCPPRER